MKIGVIFAIYGCEDYVDRCLTPWFNLKRDHDFILTATSGRFKDYADLGILNKNKSTLRKLIEWDFDFISMTGGENLLDEDSSRNRCLDFLKPHSCDLIWLVDGDEFYTEDQIRQTIQWIENNPEHDAFSLYLKNYTIRHPLFTDTWDRPTIYRNMKWGGIGRFYFDSLFIFSDDEHSIKDVEIVKIPRNVCFPEHYSWLPTEAVKDKIAYQNKRYNGVDNDIPKGCRCSFEWNENGLEFSHSFWKCRGLQIPVLCEFIGEIIDSSFAINFVREENKFTIKADKEFQNLRIKINELENNSWVGNFNIESLSPDIYYWFIPGTGRKYDREEDFKGFRLEILQNDSTIHLLNIHLKV